MPLLNGIVQNNILRNASLINARKANRNICVIKEYVEIEILNTLNVWIGINFNSDRYLNYNILCKLCYNEIKSDSFQRNIYNIRANNSNISHTHFEQHNIHLYSLVDAYGSLRCAKCSDFIVYTIDRKDCLKCMRIINNNQIIP